LQFIYNQIIYNPVKDVSVRHTDFALADLLVPLACLVFNTFIIPLLYTQREKYVYKLKKKKEGKRIDKTK
jgi:hypothetical protein